MTRTVVVTGASSGIGAATALHLAATGWHVLAGVRRAADGDRLRRESAGDLEPVIVDVTDGASLASLAARIGQDPLEGLVNNAGIVVTGPLEFIELDELRRQLEVNVVGQIAVTQALLPAIRRARGRVVFMGSIGGRIGQPFIGPYCASKHALEAVADAFRMELRPWDVDVSIIEPGAVRTPIWDKSLSLAESAVGRLPDRALELYGGAIARMTVVAQRQERMGIRPVVVARAVEHALTSPRPRPRYLVGRDARPMLLARRLIGDRRFDSAVLRLTGLPRSAPAGPMPPPAPAAR